MSRFSSQWPGYFSKDGKVWQDARQEPILNTNHLLGNLTTLQRANCDEENYHGSIVGDTTLQRLYGT